VWLTLQTLRAL